MSKPAWTEPAEQKDAGFIQFKVLVEHYAKQRPLFATTTRLGFAMPWSSSPGYALRRGSTLDPAGTLGVKLLQSVKIVVIFCRFHRLRVRAMGSLCFKLSAATLALLAGVVFSNTGLADDVPDAARESAPVSANENLGELYAEIELRSGISKSEYREALRAVLKEREWTILQDVDQRVVATQKREANSIAFFSQPGHDATITLIFTGKAVNIYCVGWELNRDGERTKPALPRSSLGRLRRDLDNRLG